MIFKMRATLAVAALVLLAGCQSLPGDAPPYGCGDIPRFADNVCLLDAWVTFGLDAQRGDSSWRRGQLEALEGEQPERKAARAVVLSWAGPGEWKRASDLYKATISEAPVRLQPLLQQWLNALEERRGLVARARPQAAAAPAVEDDAVQALKLENQALKQRLEGVSRKLEALTDIEQTINSRE